MNRWFMVTLAALTLTTAGCKKQEVTDTATTEQGLESTSSTETQVNTGATAEGNPSPNSETPAPQATPAEKADKTVEATSTPAAPATSTASADTTASAGKGAEVTLPGGTKYIDTQVGTGKEATRGSTVSVHYTGTLTDGKKFDSSLDSGQPFELTIGTTPVIKGWTEGLVGMKVGGHRSLTIPPDQGYGAEGMGPIPPNATLLFDLELLDVK